MRSKWFERHEYLVSLSIYIFISFRPSHAFVIAPPEMLNFSLISSTIDTACKMLDSSLLYEYWYLDCPGEVQMAAIQCLENLDHSIISTDVPKFSL